MKRLPCNHDDNWPERCAALGAEIKAAWRETLEGIFKTGDLLIKAKATIPRGQWAPFVRDELPFQAVTARRLMTIARDRRLRQESHATHLPICWYTLWELTALKDEQFERGLTSGRIKPDMLRADVELLKGRWVDGESSSPPRFISWKSRDGKVRFQHIKHPAKQDPILATRAAYFEATIELGPEDAERELSYCYNHFRPDANDVDDDDFNEIDG